MKKPFLIITLGLAAFLAGCGPSKAEREAELRARMEQEEKSRREMEAANKAITDMSKKLGRKPPAIDLGVKTEPAPASAPASAPAVAPEAKDASQP